MTSSSRSSRVARLVVPAVLFVLSALSAPAQHVKVFSGGGPIYLVLPNQDFSYAEYASVRSSLEASGLEVRVVAGKLAPCAPSDGDPAHAVMPSVNVHDISISKWPTDSGGVIFVGGWGASAYQYAFAGTYANSAYRPDPEVAGDVNRIIRAALAADRPVGAMSHGVSVLAWARVDGVSPIAGRSVVGGGDGPAFTWGDTSYPDGAVATRWHAERNTAFVYAAGAVGDPSTSGDDVIVDGRIITGENPASAATFGRTFAAEAKKRSSSTPRVAPVLMVLANEDFSYGEYAEVRGVLDAARIRVEVAAGERFACTPEAGSGLGGVESRVKPDLTIADALAAFRSDPKRYSAVVFVGGWGASAYQYGFAGTYQHALYNGTPTVRADVNALVALFLSRNRPAGGVGHGVTVLAWARVDGVSPLAGKTVVASPGLAPPELAGGSVVQRLTRDHVEANGASMWATHDVGDPRSPTDDVWVDGLVYSGESGLAAHAYGMVLKGQTIKEN